MMASHLRALMIIIFIGFSLADESTSGVKDEVAVEMMLEDGKSIMFPYFRQEIKTIDPILRNLVSINVFALIFSNFFESLQLKIPPDNQTNNRNNCLRHRCHSI